MSPSIPQRPRLLKIIPAPQKSMVVKGDDIVLNNPWHYHPEIELIYCIKGRGTNFVGNSIRSIEEGEVLLFGPNLPHTRQRERAYYLAHPGESPVSVVLQFREDFLGEHFFDVPEFLPVRDLFRRALRGLKFVGGIRRELAGRLPAMRDMNATESILEALKLLSLMARSEEFIYLNPENYVSTAHEKSSQKINKVYLHTVAHFREPIALADVANLTNHTIPAFCRYFKARTRKSYFQYLTGIRIAYACELLMEGTLDVSQVCFSSGFNNLSHFHKQFKRIVGLTPGEYRAQGRLKVSDVPG